MDHSLSSTLPSLCPILVARFRRSPMASKTTVYESASSGNKVL